MSSTVAPGRVRMVPGPFGVLLSRRTYLGLLYLIIELPLAIFYFSFVVAVISIGVSLAWTFVGLLILVLGLIVCQSLVRLEIILTEGLTGYEMPRANATPALRGSFCVGSQQAEDLTAMHEAEAIDGNKVSVGFAQAGDPQHDVGRGGGHQ